MPLSPLQPLLPLRPATASCAAAIGRGSPCQRQAWTEERRRRPVLACLLLWWSVVGGRGESRSTPETCWLMGIAFSPTSSVLLCRAANAQPHSTQASGGPNGRVLGPATRTQLHRP